MGRSFPTLPTAGPEYIVVQDDPRASQGLASINHLGYCAEAVGVPHQRLVYVAAEDRIQDLVHAR